MMLQSATEHTLPGVDPREAYCFAGIPGGRLKTRTIALLAILVWIASVGYMTVLASRWQLDLRVYREAAQLLMHGGDAMKASFTSHGLNFTYSPFALLVFTVLSFGPFGLVETLWWLVNAMALVLTIYFLIEADNRSENAKPNIAEPHESRRRFIAIAALISGCATIALEPVRSDIDYGQINFLLMLLVVVGITARRTPLRGSLVGLAAAIKLTPLIYLGSFFRSDRRSPLRGVALYSPCWGASAGRSFRPSHLSSGCTTCLMRHGRAGWEQEQPVSGTAYCSDLLSTRNLAAWLVLSIATAAAGLLVAIVPLHRDDSRSCDGSGPDGVAGKPGVLDAPLVLAGDRADRHRLAMGEPSRRGVDVDRSVDGSDSRAVFVVQSDGVLTDLSCDSLLLAGSTALFVWSCAEVRVWHRSTQGAPGHAQQVLTGNHCSARSAEGSNCSTTQQTPAGGAPL